jgi:uroporphyrin-3 C-methyltransferase
VSKREKQPLEAQAGREIEGEVAEESKLAHRPSRIPLVLAVVALLAVTTGLFTGYRYWSGMKQSLERLDSSLAQARRNQAGMLEQLTQNQQASQRQQQMIAAQEQALVEQRQQLEQERDQLRQQAAQLNRSLSQMQQRLGGEVSQWQVAEAEYLMRVANHRLTLMADPATALAALKSADERLHDTGDLGWNGVREVLAQEITSLRAVPRVDRAGLSATLSTLMDQVDQLTLRDEGIALEPASAGATEESVAMAAETDTGFDPRQVLLDLWEGFKSMMVIRHHERPISAMLPPEQRYFLVQNLSLKLEGAKLALMERNLLFYQDSLESSVEWLERYFALASPQVVAFREQLVALATSEIAPELPDLSGSLRALQSRREEMNRGVLE